MPHSNSISVAWISQGRLFIKRGDQPVEEHESEFAHNALKRDMQHSQNNAWKERSGVWGSMGMEPPGIAPWANESPEQRKRRIRFVTVAKGDVPEEIYYVLDLGQVGGLFKYNFELDEETRLMHSQGFRAEDISRHPEDGEIAVSTVRDDGTMGLTITRNDGLFGKSVTLSDTIDRAPSWLPDGSKRLVFQSVANRRNEYGEMIGTTTSRIELMDLKEEEITKLVEEEGSDLLQPRMTSNETVLFIRRPFKVHHYEPPSLADIAMDVVLFPYRLMRAIVHFFNFMSMAFSGKPLITSGGPGQQKRASRPLMMLYGQAVDTQNAMAKGAGTNGDKPLVPKEWELVSRSKSGDEVVLAGNVLAFDCLADGTVAYTDGRRLYQTAIDGEPAKIADGELIQKLAILNR